MDIGSASGVRVQRQDLFIYWAMGVAAGQSFIAIMMGVDTPLAMMKLGASPVVLGIAYSAWAIGRAGTGMLAGYLFDQYGGKRGILVSFGMLAMVAWGYGMLLGPGSCSTQPTNGKEMALMASPVVRSDPVALPVSPSTARA